MTEKELEKKIEELLKKVERDSLAIERTRLEREKNVKAIREARKKLQEFGAGLKV